MNRYPLWKYVLIAVVLVAGFLYALPNWFGEVPAVQVAAARATTKVDTAVFERVKTLMAAPVFKGADVFLDPQSVRVRVANTDLQLQVKDALERELNKDPDHPTYTVALNLISASPAWLTKLHALPMYLGLDLRGGVHFLMQVDVRETVKKRMESMTSGVRSALREKKLLHNGVSVNDDGIVVRFKEVGVRDAAKSLIEDAAPDLLFVTHDEGGDYRLVGALTPVARKKILDDALSQNVHTLHNRVNELGVAEPVIQQQGADRIVVELPGVQDVATAKRILGRTATLEVRLVGDDVEQQSVISGVLALGTEAFPERGRPNRLVLKRQVLLTGENLIKADAGFDQNNQSSVHLTLDAKGTRIFREVTRDNVGKRMAIVLFERGQGEVVTAPRINEEIPGGRVQITGSFTPEDAAETALVLRSGVLAAPMDIIEERTIGPSLGADNIAKGFRSTWWGFVAIAVFMIVYYRVFGVISVLSLSANLLLLVAVLSLLQATLTLPGIAAIALTLGMAIDANVLINERIREEIRAGLSPQLAIKEGYEKAWATVLDSNVTTLIAGLALLLFGSGPVRGFAVVHCIGILTSIFSAVVISRGFVNIWYGRRKRIDRLMIG